MEKKGRIVQAPPVLDKEPNLMRWIKRLFAPYIVVVSEPFSDGLIWSYIFGDENRFELRTFQSAESVFNSHTITLTALRLGAPEIFINLIILGSEQARALQDEKSYRALIESYL